MPASTPSTPAVDAWWQRPFRLFQTNLREPDALLDVERVLDHIESHGADAWLMNAGGIESFYPTDLPFQTRNRYLAQRPSGDLLGDARTATRRRGIRLFTRMDFSKVAARIADEHPDWCMVDPQGELQTAHGLYSVCPRGEYYQERAFDAISEVCERYGPDGFFFNWFSFNERDYSYRYRGVCHCRRCVDAFAKDAPGLELPDGPAHPSYPAWASASTEALNELTARFRRHVAQQAPGAGLILGQSADIMFHEANNAVGRELWPVATSEAVSSFKSLRPDVPVLVNSAIFIDMPYRLSGEEPDHYALFFIQAIARGANPSTYSMGVPGDIKYPGMAVAGEVTRFHRDHEELYGELRPAARLLIVQPSRRWQQAADLARATSEFRGVYTALMETHHPVEVMPAPDLAAAGESGALDRFEVVILPDLGPLPDETARALDAWARRGGHLVTTGTSGVATDGTAQLDGSPGMRVTQRQADPEALKNTFVGEVGDSEDVAIRQSSQMAPVIGQYDTYEWRLDSAPSGRLVSPAPIGPPELTYGFGLTGDPGWASRASGAGRVTTVPWTVGHAYYETALTYVRDLLLRAVDPPTGGVEVMLPEQCEVVIGRSGNSTVLHVVNLSGRRRRGFGQPLPLPGGSIRVSHPVRGARALVAGQELAIESSGTGCRMKLPTIGRFEVIVLEDEESHP